MRTKGPAKDSFVPISTPSPMADATIVTQSQSLLNDHFAPESRVVIAEPVAVAVAEPESTVARTAEEQVTLSVAVFSDEEVGVSVPEVAKIVPTYEMLNSRRNREDAENSQIRTAMHIARAKEKQVQMENYESRARTPRKEKEEDEAIQRANAEAEHREREGMDIREDKWFRNCVADAVKPTVPNVVTNASYKKKDGGGYEVSDYETTDYVCREYNCDYEYKSVYDD